MLGRAAERFIRTKWKSIDELAQELYATFSPEAPIVASQVTINQAAGDTTPPFVVNRAPGSTGPTYQFNNNGGTNNFGGIDIHGNQYGDTNFGGNNYGGINFGGSSMTGGDFSGGGGSGTTGGGGGIDLGTITFPGQDPATINVSVPQPQFNPFVLYGEVEAKASGSDHTVRCWAKSPLGNTPPIGILNVRFPMVDPSETIPPGTPCPVLCFPGATGTLNSILDAIGFVPTFFG